MNETMPDRVQEGEQGRSGWEGLGGARAEYVPNPWKSNDEVISQDVNAKIWDFWNGMDLGQKEKALADVDTESGRGGTWTRWMRLNRDMIDQQMRVDLATEGARRAARAEEPAPVREPRVEPVQSPAARVEQTTRIEQAPRVEPAQNPTVGRAAIPVPPLYAEGERVKFGEPILGREIAPAAPVEQAPAAKPETPAAVPAKPEQVAEPVRGPEKANDVAAEAARESEELWKEWEGLDLEKKVDLFNHGDDDDEVLEYWVSMNELKLGRSIWRELDEEGRQRYRKGGDLADTILGEMVEGGKIRGRIEIFAEKRRQMAAEGETGRRMTRMERRASRGEEAAEEGETTEEEPTGVADEWELRPDGRGAVPAGTEERARLAAEEERGRAEKAKRTKKKMGRIMAGLLAFTIGASAGGMKQAGEKAGDFIPKANAQDVQTEAMPSEKAAEALSVGWIPAEAEEAHDTGWVPAAEEDEAAPEIDNKLLETADRLWVGEYVQASDPFYAEVGEGKEFKESPQAWGPDRYYGEYDRIMAMPEGPEKDQVLESMFQSNLAAKAKSPVKAESDMFATRGYFGDTYTDATTMREVNERARKVISGEETLDNINAWLNAMDEAVDRLMIMELEGDYASDYARKLPDGTYEARYDSYVQNHGGHVLVGLDKDGVVVFMERMECG